MQAGRLQRTLTRASCWTAEKRDSCTGSLNSSHRSSATATSAGTCRTYVQVGCRRQELTVLMGSLCRWRAGLSTSICQLATAMKDVHALAESNITWPASWDRAGGPLDVSNPRGEGCEDKVDDARRELCLDPAGGAARRVPGMYVASAAGSSASASSSARSSASGSGTAQKGPLPCVEVRLPRPDQSRLVDRLARPADPRPSSDGLSREVCTCTCAGWASKRSAPGGLPTGKAADKWTTSKSRPCQCNQRLQGDGEAGETEAETAQEGVRIIIGSSLELGHDL